MDLQPGRLHHRRSRMGHVMVDKDRSGMHRTLIGLMRTLLVAIVSSCAGVFTAIMSTHLQGIWQVMTALLIPSVFLVPHLTGAEVGTDKSSFALFVVLQLAYY